MVGSASSFTHSSGRTFCLLERAPWWPVVQGTGWGELLAGHLCVCRLLRENLVIAGLFLALDLTIRIEFFGNWRPETRVCLPDSGLCDLPLLLLLLLLLLSQDGRA